METAIYYYTGTGNSLWTANKLSEDLKNTELIPVTLAGKDRINPDSQNIGFIFPVHIWGVPSRVVDFLNRLKADSTKYYFAVAVNAGQVAATLIQLKDLLQEKNIKTVFRIFCLYAQQLYPLGRRDSAGGATEKIQ